MHRLRDVFSVSATIDCGGSISWESLLALVRELSTVELAASVRASYDADVQVATLRARVAGPSHAQAALTLRRAIDRAVARLEGRWAG